MSVLICQSYLSCTDDISKPFCMGIILLHRAFQIGYGFKAAVTFPSTKPAGIPLFYNLRLLNCYSVSIANFTPVFLNCLRWLIGWVGLLIG